MSITREPRLAWAMATKSASKAAPGPWVDEMPGGHSSMTMLELCAEYSPIWSLIQRMEREQPDTAAIGHVICHADTEASNWHLDDAVAALMGRVVAMIPNWGDGRAWRQAKKDRVPHLIRIALLERRENLSGERPAWQPERIGAVMHEWYGMAITTRDWARDWLPVWSCIQVAVDDMEADALEPVSDVIGAMIRRERIAA
ncbi:hypothetical protein [Modicisalibacter coralii]|uniref:hypothetical protein n=1 Tax=Modicisalibacter coralii TaxID=2304602 RepID=UPI00100B4E2E|nr:hypothetical protein [Halomonas coralii]